jgi:CPA2 family monovalent cation:H+ antiporter-2
MIVNPVFFLDLAYVCIAAVLGATLAWRLGQPLVLGYVLGGVLIGPFTPGPAVSDLHTFELFAEIGVVLLMFSIGIEFSLRDLLRVRWVALIGGPLGIAMSVALSMAAGALLGWPPLQSMVIGMVISVASTMVLARLLLDRGELHSAHGRIMIGITLVEDLAVVVLTVVLGAVGPLEPGRLLAVGRALLVALAILVPFAYLAAKGVPRLMRLVAATRNDELFLVVALTLGLGTAAFTQSVGLSLALGAFLAGLIISASTFAHETLARLLPIRDLFVALFFVTVGALIDPATIVRHLPLLGVILALIVVGKLLIWTIVVRLFRAPLSTSVLVAAGLTQIGEFSFILVQVARTAGHVGDDVYNATLAASLLSILINAVLVRVVPGWLGAARVRHGAAPATSARESAPRQHVVLCGFGRVGSAVGEALETFGVPFTVIERDPDLVVGLRGRGRDAIFGDAGQREILRHAGAAQAALVILAIPELAPAHRAVRAVRTFASDVPILARAHGRAEAEQLGLAGASEVIQPELEASATLIRHSLARLRLPKEQALAYLERFRDAMERGDAEPRPAAHTLPEIREIVIAAEGAMTDRSLREAAIRERFGVTIVAIARGGRVVLNPPPDTRLHDGDAVRVFGLPEQVASFAGAARGGAASC